MAVFETGRRYIFVFGNYFVPLQSDKNVDNVESGNNHGVRLVVFDFDGTLGDTRDKIVGVMQHVMLECGLEVADAAVCASTIGLPLKDCFRKIYPHLDDAGAEACADTYRRYFFSHAQELVPDMFPHVVETLDELHRRGVAMAIASSRTSRSLLGFVRDMGLDRYIGRVVGCEDVAATKPAPDALIAILEAEGVASDEALVVGDMPVDILMGRAVGVRTVGVTYGNSTPVALVAAGADRLIDSIDELLELL